LKHPSASDETIESKPPPARTFAGGRYVVRRALGGGAQKIVFLVHDRDLDRECALGLIQTEALSEDAVGRFRREARAMGRLGAHSNIVTVHDLGMEEGHPYVVCEYVPGGDLRDELQRAQGPLSVARSTAIATDILRALEFAHAQGIVHRDLKPANVWLGRDGAAKLGDFGMAHAADWSRMTAAGTILGTPSYMSPEQARGEHADARSDLYAFGCLLHEMLAGRPPFEAEEVMGVLYQHVHVPPPPVGHRNGSVPRALERLVLRLLAKAPADRPASAKEVLGELERAARGELAPGATSAPEEQAVVGRRQELAALEAALDSALAGRGMMRFLVGEGGIGKTRLAREIGRIAAARGARVLLGRTTEVEGAPPYLPFAEAIGESSLGLEGGGATGTDRYAMFQTVTTHLRTLAQTSGLLLVLEDLHWADRPSLLLMQHLARQLAGSRILIVGTYRDTDVDRRHALFEVLADLRRERLHERILLRGLPDEDARSLVRSLSGAVSDSLIAQILQESEGNPFFIEELLKHVAEAGAATVAELGIPEGIREVIGRRLARLSPECNRMLTLASIVGGSFPWAIVAVVSGEDEDRLLDLLDEALAAQVIRERADGAGSYEFVHALIRQSLREELSAPRRARMHRQVAEANEKVYGGDLDSHRAEIAHHFFAAGTAADVGRGIPHALKAAERAMKLLAFEDAVSVLETARAGQDLVGAEPAARAEVLVSLGLARIRGGDPDAGQKDCEEAIGIAVSIGDTELRARAALAYAQVYTFARVMPKTVAHLKESLAALSDEDSALRARVLARLAGAMQPDPNVDVPMQLARDSIAMGRRVGDEATLLAVLHSAMSALMDIGDPAERIPLNQEMLALATKLSDRVAALRAHVRLVFDFLDRGDVPSADGHIEACEKLARDFRQPGWQWQARMFRALRAEMEGRFADAERSRDEAIAIAKPLHDSNAGSAYIVQRVCTLVLQRRFEEAMALVPEAAAFFPNELMEFFFALPAVRLGWTEGLADRLRGFGVEFGGPDAVVWFAYAWALVDPERIVVERIYEGALPHLQRNSYWGASGFVMMEPFPWYLGLAAAHMDRWDEAQRHFADAVRRAGAMGMRPHVAAMQLDWARALSARGRPEDGAQIRELRAAAREIAQSLGMDRMIAEIDAS